MPSTTTTLLNYGYKTIINELRPLIERYLRNEDANLGIFGIKLISRDNGEAKFLVITNQKTLWTFRYEFENPAAWPQLPLQNSARYVERSEMQCFEDSYRDIQGQTPEEFGDSTMHFFIETPTCLQKEEQQRLKEQLSKKAG